MEPKLYCRPTRPNHPLVVTDPAKFLEMFQAAFGYHNTGHGWYFDNTHIATLKGLAAAHPEDAAVLMSLVVHIIEDGEIQVWAEWPNEALED